MSYLYIEKKKSIYIYIYWILQHYLSLSLFLSLSLSLSLSLFSNYFKILKEEENIFTLLIRVINKKLQ